jgi:hypothetical protein
MGNSEIQIREIFTTLEHLKRGVRGSYVKDKTS